MSSKWLLSASLVLTMFATSCAEPTSELQYGYYLIDGGGSKISLSRPDGTILINYSVRRILEKKSGVIVEYEDSSGYCSYLFLSREEGQLREKHSKYADDFIKSAQDINFKKMSETGCVQRKPA